MNVIHFCSFPIIPASTSHPNHTIPCHIITPNTYFISSSRELSIFSVSLLQAITIMANNMKPWLQLNGFWRLVSGTEKRPTGKPKVSGRLQTSRILLFKPPLCLQMKACWTGGSLRVRAAGALKTTMSPELRMLIRDCEDNPLLIWDTLKATFVQHMTTPHFDAYHTLLSTQKNNSESLASLINKVDKQIRVIKSLHVQLAWWAVSTLNLGACLSTTSMWPQNTSEVSEMAHHPYILLVGTLVYLTITTRLGIAYATRVLARFNFNPGLAYWQAAKHVLCYLKGTPSTISFVYQPSTLPEPFIT